MRLESIIQRNTRALQPAATAVPIGTLYYVTDESLLERSNGTAWEIYGSGGSGVTASDVIPNPKLRRSAWANFAFSGANGIAEFNTSMATLGTLSNDSDAIRSYVRFSISTASQTGVRRATTGIGQSAGGQGRYSPLFYADIKTGDATSIADVRIFIGLSSGDLTGDTPNASYAAVRFSTVVGDPNWQFVCGTSNVNLTVVSTGVAIAADTRYQIKIWSPDAGVTWYCSINDSIPVSITVNVPTTNLYLSYYCWLANIPGGIAKFLRIARLYMECD